MNNQIIIREVRNHKEAERFWSARKEMLVRDIFLNCDIGLPMSKDELEKAVSEEIKEHTEELCNRESNPAKRVFFEMNGDIIGFAMYCVYNSEDGKCFITDFCIFPSFRSKGFGSECFEALSQKAKDEGALYFELNTHCRRAKRFWEKQGLRYNGFDDHGNILLCKPPKSAVPIEISVFDETENIDVLWQFKKLQNGFLKEIREEIADDAKTKRLIEAVKAKKIIFFLAKRGYRVVGMCSVTISFSTFACKDIGTFDDFFIEPVFRKQGIAKKLAETAFMWCRENEISSVAVCCSPCDEDMYRHIGFDIPLGKTFAHNF